MTRRGTLEMTNEGVSNLTNKRMNRKSITEIAVKVLVAALTAFLTAISTTSCMGCGPIEF